MTADDLAVYRNQLQRVDRRLGQAEDAITKTDYHDAVVLLSDARSNMAMIENAMAQQLTELRAKVIVQEAPSQPKKRLPFGLASVQGKKEGVAR